MEKERKIRNANLFLVLLQSKHLYTHHNWYIGHLLHFCHTQELKLEQDMLFQDRVVLFDLDPVRRIALIFLRGIGVWALGTAQFDDHSISWLRHDETPLFQNQFQRDAIYTKFRICPAFF